jgi:photosystem II stability/assembly factor-like uncharacterized protein
MKKYILLTLSMFFSTSVQSEQIFNQINFGTQSSMVSCIAINNQDHVFLGTYYNEGIYRSTNNGQTWTKVKPHTNVTDILSIALHPSGYIIVGQNGSNNNAKGLFVSTNNGDSYVKMSTGLAVGAVRTVTVAPNGYVFAAVGKDVYCSTDTCKTWVVKSTGLTGSVPVDQIACAPNGYLFLYKLKNIFRSIDNGSNWTEMTQGWVQDSIWDILISKKGHVFVATEQNYIFQTVDNGDSWGRVHNGLEVYKGKVVSLGEDSQGNLYAGSYGTDLVANLHRSTDDGGRWSVLGTALGYNVLANLTFDSEGYCYATCGGTLHKSTTPLVEPNGAQVDSKGGRIDQTNIPELKQNGLDNLFIEFPEGAVKEQVSIKINIPTSIPSEKSALRAVEFLVEGQANGFAFDKPVTIGIPYPESVPNETPLTLMYWNQVAGDWEQIEMLQSIVRNQEQHTVTAQVTHFSIYGVIDASTLSVNDNSPTVFALSQNYPNPFNPTTTINFTLPQAGMVDIEVYNVTGQNVDTILNGSLSEGSHAVVWEASHCAGGVYFYTVRFGTEMKTGRMLLVK